MVCTFRLHIKNSTCVVQITATYLKKANVMAQTGASSCESRQVFAFSLSGSLAFGDGVEPTYDSAINSNLSLKPIKQCQPKVGTEKYKENHRVFKKFCNSLVIGNLILSSFFTVGDIETLFSMCKTNSSSCHVCGKFFFPKS